MTYLMELCELRRSHQPKILGQVENAEVRKPKYGSEKKSRLSVFSALMTHVKAL